ncbi:unnamed protein product [Spodoptera exigua]|nr:unnamed protein product [Spodoptera exigua]
MDLIVYCVDYRLTSDSPRYVGGKVDESFKVRIIEKCININVDGWRGRGRPKKIWMDCVRSDMEDRRVSDSVTSDRTEWKKKHIAPTPNKKGQGQEADDDDP